MIVVTNIICVKKGMGAKMAPMFTKEGPLQNFDGFEKVEVLVSEQDDHDEMSVNMYWQTQAQFEVWRQSDAFKQAHRRPENGGPTAENNPIISSKLVIANVSAEIQKALN